MKNDKLVSIIIPVYNAEKYLNNCIDSLLNQTYNDIELIFIDDKSTDNSLQILNKYRKNEKIKIIEKEKNSGVSSTRNLGIKKASGKYIMFVDSDDRLEKKCVEEMVSIAENENADIVFGKFQRTTEMINLICTGTKEKIIFTKKDIEKIIESILINKKYKVNSELFGYAWGKIYKRDLIKDIIFDESIRFREDTLFNIEVYKKSDKIIFYDKDIYFYYINNEAASFRFFDNYENEVCNFFKKIYNICGNLNIDYICICGLYMYMTYLKHYAMHKDLKKSKLKEIKKSFKSKMWRYFFKNVNYKQLTIPYKLLTFCYRRKCAMGIKILYRINEIRGRLNAK